MALCGTGDCNCAFFSETLTIEVNGNVVTLEQAEFSSIVELENAVANIIAELLTLPDTYVDVTGDVMTGKLDITTTSAPQLELIGADDQAWVYFTDSTGFRMGYVGGFLAETFVRVWARTDMGIRIGTSDTERMRILSTGTILLHKTASNQATAGNEFLISGNHTNTVAVDTQNHAMNKVSAAVVSGASYAQYRLSGTSIGSVTRNAATSAVLYNISSDERRKNIIGELDPELAEYIARLVTPVMYSWKSDPDDTPMAGYIAQRVAEAWPQAVECGLVTPGWGEESDRTWDDAGNETTPDGVYQGWQMDYNMVIPILHAAWRSSANKLDALTARVEALEAVS